MLPVDHAGFDGLMAHPGNLDVPVIDIFAAMSHAKLIRVPMHVDNPQSEDF